MARHVEVATSPIVQQALPALADLASMVDGQVRTADVTDLRILDAMALAG